MIAVGGQPSAVGGPRLDTRVIGATAVTPRGRLAADVGIKGGQIAGLYAPGECPEAAETIEARGQWLLPGVIDVHFHCRAPAHPEWEDFDTGTQAAAAGGVTTIFEMPIAEPGVHSAAIFRARRELAETQAHVDFALWGGGGAPTEADIRGMAEEGAVGFKLFLHGAPEGRESEFVGLTATDTASLHRAFIWIAATGLPCAVHCEDDDLTHAFTTQLRAAGRVEPRVHGTARPEIAETLAVARVLALAEPLEMRVHFPHVSSVNAADMITRARQRGLPVSMETCPHYLLFDDSVMDRLGPYAKIHPPIRTERDRLGLWQALRDGAFDAVASDHAPYIPEAKEPGWHDIFAAPSGSPGVETLAPSLLDRALRGDLEVERAVELLTERPARVFGLYPRKGILAPGSDADLVLFDPDANWTVRRERLFTRSRESARLFDGVTFRGRMTRTLVRGVTVYHDGQIVAPCGHGRFVRPVASER